MKNLNIKDTIYINQLDNETIEHIKLTLENKGFELEEVETALNGRVSDLQDTLNYCNDCKDIFLTGYEKFKDSDLNYCPECHEKIYTEEEWEKLYNENPDECYYTEEE